MLKTMCLNILTYNIEHSQLKSCFFNSKICIVMGNKQQLILIILGILLLLVVIIIVVLVRNTRKTKFAKQIEDINVRFNAIKTIPLAFKLNKAQAMARRNKDTAEQIESYYKQYENTQRDIDSINDMLVEIDDDFANHNYKSLKSLLIETEDFIAETEKEVTQIDKFLEQFADKENQQREFSTRLKERYLEVKMKVNEHSNSFSIAYDGVSRKLEAIEDKFSQSEEWLYANDYVQAQNIMDEIDVDIENIKKVCAELPDLVKEAKGVLPVLLEEIDRQYALARQRGVYLAHIDIDKRIEEAKKSLNEATKDLMNASTDGIGEKLVSIKKELNEILSSIESETADFNAVKNISDEVARNISEVKYLLNYINTAYQKDASRFDMNEAKVSVEKADNNVKINQSRQIALLGSFDHNELPASKIKEDFSKLLKEVEEDNKLLSGFKKKIDKNSNDEQRARTQLVKLQVVLNEIEVKVNEYHLPAIAASYREDLKKGRGKVARIKELLEEIPLNIEELNKVLDESIDYIYTFYNNVNNIVGMAIMVENAIVFGNKYRSTYPEVDRDLSNAEFSYINGEYTKALTMAISCMETLFPNTANEKILENK